MSDSLGPFPGLWTFFPSGGPPVSLAGWNGVAGVSTHFSISVAEATRHQVAERPKMQQVDIPSVSLLCVW